MNPWFRFYNEVAHDPKVQMLPDHLYRTWSTMLCIYNENDCKFPSVDKIAYTLRLSVEETRARIEALIAAELFDDKRGVVTPHNWKGRQFQSDSSTARVKRFRNARRNVSETANETKKTVTVTPTDTDTDTDTDTEQNRTDTEQTIPTLPLPEKHTYGKFENVNLRVPEVLELNKRFGHDGAGQRIDALSEYIASKRVHYKSHYAVILMWERKNGVQPNGHLDKQQRNAETARRLLSRLDSENSGGRSGGTA